jgi:3',5'-cyclic AMP phosphodiesterase CpdA
MIVCVLSSPPVRIAQISDLHFGRAVPAVADALVADLRDARPALVAVCGDLTQTVGAAEFRAARVHRRPARPGAGRARQSRPARLAGLVAGGPAWRRWRRHMGTDPHGAVTFTADGLTAVGVNTARC